MCLIYISLRFSFGPPALQNWSFFVLGLRLKQSLRHEARFKKGICPANRGITCHLRLAPQRPAMRLGEVLRSLSKPILN